MHLIRLAVLLGTVIVGVDCAEADIVARVVPGGYCVIGSTVVISDAGSDPNDYHIAPDGRLTIKTPGQWTVYYKVSDQWSDPNPVFIDFVGVDVQPNGPTGFTVKVWGRNLTGACGYGGVGQLAFRLLQGGTITAGGSISAPQYDLWDDGGQGPGIELGGSLTRPITIRTIYGPSSVLIRGDVTGAGELTAASAVGLIKVLGNHAGRIWIQGNFHAGGRILINGGMSHGSFLNEVLIATVAGTSMSPDAAIAIDYDGWHSGDDWQAGATVAVSGTTYGSDDANHTSRRIYRITECRGDMNNDEVVNAADGVVAPPSGPYVVARDTPLQYATDFPGLDGSRKYHGNCNQDVDLTVSPPIDLFNSADDGSFERLKTITCCVADCDDDDCPTDLNKDGVTDISDMAILLSSFGLPPEQRAYPCSDINGDGAVDIVDLAVLLSNFGLPCNSCPGLTPPPGGGGEMNAAYAIAEVEPQSPTIETTCSMHAGNVELELALWMPDAGDDWTVAGLKATTSNGATFVYAGGPATAASFVSGPTGAPLVVGSFEPPAATAAWSAGELNASWLDLVNENPGVFSLAHVSIGIAGVTWNAGWGPPTAYFSEYGPNDANDIPIASVRLLAATRSLSGAFVKKTGDVYLAVP